MPARFFTLSAIALLIPVEALSRIIEKTSFVSCAAEVMDASESLVLVIDTGLSSCRVAPEVFASADYVRSGPGDVFGFVSGHVAPYPNAAVSAFLSVTDEFYTAGSPRDGIAFLWMVTSRYGEAPGAGEASVSVTDLTYGAHVLSHDCSEHLCYSWDPFSPPGTPIPVLFRLGVPFFIQIRSSLETSGYSSGPAGLEIGADVEIRLYESDEVTPVTISEIPEPRASSTIASGVISIMLLAVARGKVINGATRVPEKFKR